MTVRAWFRGMRTVEWAADLANLESRTTEGYRIIQSGTIIVIFDWARWKATDALHADMRRAMLRYASRLTD